ncbi:MULTISPECIES: class I SAM-dependent methyltransferase [unclassified Sphingobium]|uniref:class I SAM-dependent methyltransferase n=1 Tax=unclassified Sphingobium TaxID=2611147 RepID=UPI001C315D3A|nr:MULTISPECIES: class I SAM-dependent methyltransferase [unclassified Sphingobium]MBV2150530.1 class I SAM-dependent methyltransferase [Sphingobium sp. AS12]
MIASHDLLAEFVARYPAQPATAFWRGIEIEQLARIFDSAGVGLDLGCGDGILTDILFKRIGMTPNLIGVDIDPLETEAAASYAFYDRIHTCAAQAIPEPDASIDYVISNSVLEHIPDLEGVIAEVGRVLKPGGRFYFTVPAPGFHQNLRGSIVPGISRERYLDDLDKRLAHFHYLSALDWHDMAGRHGLAVDNASGYLDQTETRRWENLSRVTGGLLHSLSFGRSRPIEIQRALKIRDLQNRMALPASLASGIAKMIATDGEPDQSSAQSCLLVVGHRPRD